MKVILKQKVSGLGERGELKEVKEGYAKNYLIPQGLVVQADSAVARDILVSNSVNKEKIELEKKNNSQKVKEIEGKEFIVKVKVGSKGQMFSSVGLTQVKDVIEKELNYSVKDVEGLPIKCLGRHKIWLIFVDGLRAQVDIVVESVK